MSGRFVLLLAVGVVVVVGSAAVVKGRNSGGPPPFYPVPQLPWTAGMETGDLSEWYARQSPSPEAEQHSGDGECTVSTDVAHTGRASLKCVAGAEDDATRMFRYAEPRSGVPLVYSAWFYLPKYVRIGKHGNWNIFQFKSKHFPADRSDPFLSFNVRDMHDGTYTVYIYKKPELYNIRPHTEVSVRPGEWFGVRALLRQSGAGQGRVRVWILRDNHRPVEIIDVAGLTTRYADGTGVQDWSVNNYGARLDPFPAVLYIDDASITRPE